MTSAASNARWIASSQAVKVLLQLASISLLARLLTPHDYGLMAMVVVVTNFIALLRDLGTAAAVIQDPHLSERTTATVFTLNLLIGAVLGIAVAALSPMIAASFRTAEIVQSLIFLSPSFLITSAGAVSKALLERRSRFALVARTEVLSSVLGLGVTLACAWAGQGVMSWVLGILVTACFSTAAFAASSGWMPERLLLDRVELKRLLGFTGNLSGFNFVNYFSRNADAFIIGRFLGPVNLGIYSTAYKVMLFPLQNLTFVATRALYPVMCRLQGDVRQQASLYFRSLSVIVFFTAPLMTGVFVLREPFIRVFMGAKWDAAADILVWLAPVGLLQSMISTMGSVLMAQARTGLLFKLGIFSAVSQVSAFLIGVSFGIGGVAAAYLVANLVGALPNVYFLLKALDERLVTVARCIAPPVSAAVTMGIVLTLLMQTALVSKQAEWLKLIGLSLSGAALYLVFMVVVGRPTLRSVMSVLPHKMRGQKVG